MNKIVPVNTLFLVEPNSRYEAVALKFTAPEEDAGTRPVPIFWEILEGPAINKLYFD